MNDTPARPAAAPADKVSETAHALEATGSQPAAAGAAPGATRPSGAPPASGTEVMHTIGGYSVVKKIGEGGMGAVYLAEDTKLGRKVAIKTMRPALAANPADRDRFVREARAAAAVESDYIVPIWFVGDAADGTPFIAMPFLQGEPLDARLKREPAAPVGLVLKVAREVSEGLAAAHARGLIHRDIKPANVWLEGNLASKQSNEQVRRCRILDFGLARSVDKEDAQITASGAVLGTPAYMAPEQARGERVDHRADLFSLGVTLYRMATGEPPFQGPNVMVVLFALVNQPPRPVRELAPHLPPAVADLIERLMSKDPAARPQSAAEVAATVRQIVKDLQTRKAGGGAPASAPPPASASQSVPVYVLPAAAPNPWEEMTESGGEAPVAKKPAPAKRGRVPRGLLAGAALGLLSLCALLAVVVIRVQTAEGTLVVELNDPDVEARVRNGKLVLVDADGRERYAISPAAERDKKIDAGKYTVRVEGADGLTLDTPEFTLKKNGKVTVRVTLDPKAVAKKAEPPKRDPPGGKAAPSRQPVLVEGGDWRVEGKELVQAKPGRAKLFFGDDTWTDYDLTFETRTDSKLSNGLQGSITLFRAADAANYHVFVLGAYGGKYNEAHRIEQGKWVRDLNPPRQAFEADRWYKVLIRVRGTRIRCEIDGALAFDYTDSHFPAGRVGFSTWDEVIRWRNIKVTGASGAVLFEGPPELPSVKDPLAPILVWGEWVPLFNGKDLTGWATEKGGVGSWNVVDGAITCTGGGDLLYTKRADLGDFHLRAEVKINKQGNSGIYFRAAKPIAPLRAGSGDLEAQIFLGGGAQRTGSLYKVVDFSDNLVQADTWFTYEIIAEGNRIRLVVDGKETVNYADARPGRRPEGHIALQHHDKETAVYFRKVEVKLPKPVAAFDADRKAAEYVLSVGGAVWLNDDGRQIRDTKDLPGGAFRLTGFDLHENRKIDAAGMANFRGCRHIRGFNLENASATDEALAYLADCKDLSEIVLAGTPATDAGMVHFKDCKRLVVLKLWASRVGDAGLASFAGCKDLTGLNLGLSRVTDDGLTALRNFPHLKQLDLYATAVTDAGLARLKVCDELTDLRLYKTKVSDSGLAHLKECKRLTDLSLEGVAISDAGLAHLKDCPNLTSLNLKETKVTAKGAAELAKALPQCRIVHDGGTIEPKAAANGGGDRKAAEWVLSAGGTVRVGGAAADIKKPGDLPKGDFRLTAINLTAPVKEADLAACRGCADLTVLYLAGTKIGGHGLEQFKDSKGLKELYLSGTQVGDASVPFINQFTKLTDLSVGQTKITAEGVKQLAAGLPACRIQHDGGTVEPKPVSRDADRKAAEWVLSIGGTVQVNRQEKDIADAGALPQGRFTLTTVNLGSNQNVTDAGLANLKDCKGLWRLDLIGTQVTDEGLLHFKNATSFGMLHLSNTRVTDEGLANFKDCKGLRLLSAANTRVTDAGLANFKGCTELQNVYLNSTKVTDATLENLKSCDRIQTFYVATTTVTDAGLAHLKGWTELTELNLTGTQVTDKGLAPFKDQKRLTLLILNSTAVTDAGLAPFAGCKDLKRLSLQGTAVTDAGVLPFAACKRLRTLELNGTRVTARAVQELKKALPGCAIGWDGEKEPAKK